MLPVCSEICRGRGAASLIPVEGGEQRNESREIMDKVDFHLLALLVNPGLPDGLFSNRKSQFGYLFEDLKLKNVDLFYGLLK
jgi:hypothetical protein